MRLIDADKVLEQFRQYRLIPAPKTNGEKAITDILMDAIYRQAEIVNNAPTVDVEPIKHGRWISTDEMIGYRCSVCGVGSDRKANYCPNCGARMDEVEE